MNKMNACFVSLFTALLFLPVPVCHLPGLRAAALQQGAVLLAVLGEGGHGAAGPSGAGSLLLSVRGGRGGNCSACSLTVWSCAMVCVQFVCVKQYDSCATGNCPATLLSGQVPTACSNGSSCR